MNAYPRSLQNVKPSSPHRSKPQNQCYACGKKLLIDVLQKNCFAIYDDSIKYGDRVYAYACYPQCDPVDEELI